MSVADLLHGGREGEIMTMPMSSCDICGRFCAGKRETAVHIEVLPKKTVFVNRMLCQRCHGFARSEFERYRVNLVLALGIKGGILAIYYGVASIIKRHKEREEMF